jgi:TonB family protein
MRKFVWTVALLGPVTALAWARQQPELQVDKDQIYSPGNGVKAPKLAHAVPAVYPGDPKLAGTSCSRVVGAVINPDGSVGMVQARDKNLDPFDEAAIEAVKRSEFKPGTFHDAPAPVTILLWIPFVKKKAAIPEVLPIQPDVMPKPIFGPNVSPPATNQDSQKKIRIKGKVLVSLEVDEDGAPRNLWVMRSDNKELDQPVLDAISKYRFHPALKYGVPIPVSTVIESDLRLY